MAYYKINPTGCGENKGLVEVRYDCYLSRDDTGNEQHYVTVPDFTDAVYEGKIGDMGPEDVEDYRKWVESLPTITRNNPFCCHFVQFEASVTDEEIVKKGEEILKMAFDNFQKGALHENKNAPFTLSKEPDKQESALRASSIKTTDYVVVEAALPDTYRIRG